MYISVKDELEVRLSLGGDICLSSGLTLGTYFSGKYLFLFCHFDL